MSLTHSARNLRPLVNALVRRETPRRWSARAHMMAASALAAGIVLAVALPQAQAAEGADTASASFTVQDDSQQAGAFPAGTYPGPFKTGEIVHLDASRSTSQSGVITNYEWDLDGDGTFETSGSPTQSVTLTKPGSLTITLRVTSLGGETSTAFARFNQIVAAPPSGDVGISINGGDQFTNTPQVRVSLVWPVAITFVRLSNDGGLTDAKQFDVAPSVPWTLQSSGPERLPKTVYARYGGYPFGFQDDIILDETPPAISSAQMIPSASRAAVSAAHPKSYRVKLSASDKTSGVSTVQVATSKSKPSKPQKYAPSFTVHGSAPRYVRVKDRAGNNSKWRALKQRR